MTTWGEKLGRFGLGRIGAGVSQKPPISPDPEDVFYRSWNNGIIHSEPPESLPEGAVYSMVDMEVDQSDAVVRAPGVRTLADLTPRSTRYLFEQSGIGFTTELVCIDAPHLGYSSGGSFTFHNLGLANPGSTGWCTVDYAGILIFSNGTTKIYRRDPASITATDITSATDAFPCQTLGTAFGRLFEGAYIDPSDGLISLGVRWNAANASPSDFTGLGAGNELLIANNRNADRLEAIVPIGLQTIAFLCRQSLWVGYQTGDSNRPADFQLRFPGLGCVARDTARATPFGVMYLSDDGVCLFDLNTSQVVSQPINSLLLPIDYTRISQYQGLYDPTTQKYLLMTPFGIFTYEFPRGSIPARWFYRSFIPDTLVPFTDQSGSVFWNDAVGAWDQQTLTWEGMSIAAENAPILVFYGKGTKVGFEDYSAFDNMGVQLSADPLVLTRQPKQNTTDLQMTTMLEVQYRAAADAVVTFMAQDANGELTLSVTKTLPGTSNARKRVLIFLSNWSGMGADLQISYRAADSNCAIERIRRVIVSDGEATQAAL